MLLTADQFDLLIEDITSQHSMDKRDLLERIDKVSIEMGRLLDRSTSGVLYLLDIGMLAPFTNIKYAEPSETMSAIFEVPLSGTVTTRQGPDGRSSKELLLDVQDNTGSITMALYDGPAIEFFQAMDENKKVLAFNLLCKETKAGLVLRTTKGTHLFHFEGNDFVLKGLLDAVDGMQFMSIDEINTDDTIASNIPLSGTITRMQPLHRFNRKDGSEGCILKCELFDGTGMTWLVFWDSLAEGLQDLKEGDGIDIVGAYKKAGDIGTLYTNYRTRVNRRQ